MGYKRAAQAISIIVSIVGASVVIGWLFDIGALKSILPQWVTMKFSTALAFVLSGILLYFIVVSLAGDREKAQLILLVVSFLIFLVMALLFASALFGQQSLGLEQLFVKESEGAVKTAVPGRPSAPTALNFILIAAAGILAGLETDGLKSWLQRLGWVITAVGGIAVLGYILGIPALYYLIEGINTAMAAHTAFLFVLIGAGLISAGRISAKETDDPL